jgi:hypothetical protein
MISILYNANDFEAASIALKVQSLSQNQPVRIYIVPKHYGRNESEVFENLKDSRAAIFLSFDIHELDGDTGRELDFLKKNGVVVKYIVPTTFNIPILQAAQRDVYSFVAHKNNVADVVNNLSSTIADLKKEIEETARVKPVKKSKIKSENADNSVFLMIVLLAVVLLGMLTSSEEATA